MVEKLSDMTEKEYRKWYIQNVPGALEAKRKANREFAARKRRKEGVLTRDKWNKKRWGK